MSYHGRNSEGELKDLLKDIKSLDHELADDKPRPKPRNNTKEPGNTMHIILALCFIGIGFVVKPEFGIVAFWGLFIVGIIYILLQTKDGGVAGLGILIFVIFMFFIRYIAKG